jgi:hypothetical protein
MRFSHKMIYAAAPLSVAGLLATTAATPASAASQPPRHRQAYGSVELGSPLQYERFRALQGFGRNHGVVDYTNWTYAEPGSGVFAPAQGAHALNFAYQGQQYAHTLNGGLALVARGPETLAFRGSGAYNAQAGATWRIAGVIFGGNQLRATVVYNGALSPGYRVVLRGTIAPDGSAAGRAVGRPAGAARQLMTFAMPAGTFTPVLHYTARVQSAQISRHDATFRFTIPAGNAGLGGTRVTVRVHDGGWGPARDRYAHGTGTVLQPYPIIGGPGVTVRR